MVKGEVAMKIEFIQEDRDFGDREAFNNISMKIDGVEVIEEFEDENIGEIARVILEHLGVTDFKIEQSWD
jgi:hypothetical protein